MQYKAPADGEPRIMTGSAFDIGAFEVKAPLSVSDSEFNNTISITPNPTNDIFRINIQGNTALEKVIIYNELGQKIKEAATNEIDISNLVNGIYFTRITLKSGKTGIKKLIKY